MKYTEEGKSVKWNVGLARASVLSLAPTESFGPRKTLFTGVAAPNRGPVLRPDTPRFLRANPLNGSLRTGGSLL